MNPARLIIAWITTLVAAALGVPAYGQTVLRVATFNVEDLRSEDLQGSGSPRAKRLAEIIQRLAPNIILINEIAYDVGSADTGSPAEGKENVEPGRNGQRFADLLAVPQAPGLAPLRFKAFMAPVNTGMPSGFDLNNDGKIATTIPTPSGWSPESPPAPPKADAQAYAQDCWGFGTFPGQYGMTLLVDERLVIMTDEARTFRKLPWDYMPGAFLPIKPEGGPWYDDEEKAVARLSSKSHWDVPVKFPDGRVIHFLCSHPTPPAFDGPEKRNARRNHDEIRFWPDYINNASYIVDDNNRQGGLDRHDSFIILGDLNADPDPEKGSSYKQPITNSLAGCERIDLSFVPESETPWPELDSDDTAMFKMRVDYVLPSRNLEVLRGGVWRPPLAATGKPEASMPSDHFPVWLELRIPPMMTDQPAPSP